MAGMLKITSVAALAAAAATYVVAGGATAETAPPSPAEAEAAAATETGALAEMVLGDPDAPVTVIEYASVTCNHCALWHEEVFPEIKAQYIDTGKVRFVLREIPIIPDHPALIARSYAGSMLARCAADAGGSETYFSVMGALFDRQKTWAFGSDAKGELLKIAAEAGLDEAAFDACIQRADLKSHIDANIDAALNDYRIEGTPGFIIAGAYHRVFSAEDVSKALDDALEASR